MRPDTGCVGGNGAKGAVTVVEDHSDIAAVLVGGDDVEVCVAIEIGDGHILWPAPAGATSASSSTAAGCGAACWLEPPRTPITAYL